MGEEMITICDGCPLFYRYPIGNDICGAGYITEEIPIMKVEHETLNDAMNIPEYQNISTNCELHEIKYGDKIFKPERREI